MTMTRMNEHILSPFVFIHNASTVSTRFIRRMVFLKMHAAVSPQTSSLILGVKKCPSLRGKATTSLVATESPNSKYCHVKCNAHAYSYIIVLGPESGGK